MEIFILIFLGILLDVFVELVWIFDSVLYFYLLIVVDSSLKFKQL